MGLVGGLRLRHGKAHGSPFGNRGTQVPTWNWFLSPRWLKTIEFGRMFLISLKENVTSGTHPHEVVQFETIAVGPFPVVQLQRARKKVGFTGRLKYSSFGQTRVFT